MSNGFYRAFEERYYAPREYIKKLRRQYLPFIVPLAQAFAGSPTFDIGCGRGEWLELMQEQGLAPFGVDLDPGMLDDCLKLELPAHKGDAVQYLQTLDGDSQAVVSAFHVVEHISFEQLRQVIVQSHRVLKPGGLLIMETPNPENIAVGTRNFYLDPTHQRPIPDLLLSFMTEYYGFVRVKTLRLQEDKSLVDAPDLSLLNVLTGVSPDYAVVAQKQGPDSIMQVTAEPFSKDYGVSLAFLADAYHQQKGASAQQAIAIAQEAQAQARQSAEQIRQLQADMRRADAQAQQAQATSQQAMQQVHDVYASTSWRVTAPLRWLGMQRRRLEQEGISARSTAFCKKLARPVVQHGTRYVDSRPQLRKRISDVAHRIGVHKILHNLYLRAFDATRTKSGGTPGADAGKPVPSGLTPRAARIYTQLKEAIANKNNGNELAAVDERGQEWMAEKEAADENKRA